jgi:hypothetical protein
VRDVESRYTPVHIRNQLATAHSENYAFPASNRAIDHVSDQAPLASARRGANESGAMLSQGRSQLVQDFFLVGAEGYHAALHVFGRGPSSNDCRTGITAVLLQYGTAARP